MDRHNAARISFNSRFSLPSECIGTPKAPRLNHGCSPTSVESAGQPCPVCRRQFAKTRIVFPKFFPHRSVGGNVLWLPLIGRLPFTCPQGPIVASSASPSSHSTSHRRAASECCGWSVLPRFRDGSSLRNFFRRSRGAYVGSAARASPSQCLFEGVAGWTHPVAGVGSFTDTRPPHC